MAAIGTTPLQDRVWVVTGATSGIGKATALGLARLGGTVVLACRDAARGGEAQQEIVRDAKNPKVTLMIVDLASQASIVSFAEEFTQDYRRLDALVNNAGIFTRERMTTPDGLELQFAVNYLGGFLLSHLLLDLLLASTPSRIVNVASSAHKGATIDFDNLQGERAYKGYKAYGQSKLAQILFTVEYGRCDRERGPSGRRQDEPRLRGDSEGPPFRPDVFQEPRKGGGDADLPRRVADRGESDRTVFRESTGPGSVPRGPRSRRRSPTVRRQREARRARN